HGRAARAFPSEDLPLYRAHVLVDHARIADAAGDVAAAETSRAQASEIYASLGATPYLSRLTHQRRVETEAPVLTLDITDRERDILTLVLRGLSYAQIARDLFITQSTVSYHLGNLYAKANVRGKHELAALARKAPTQFGLTAAGV
ncbi:helix-turn-helix transcriptional regulator, partial [Jatrophihabitans sp.]|uniref:helix-turn-helix transcriptional regulator n=1 Tax=Jatrophihabitans sp. TaxID=1932789 RepID=UPI0030C68DF6|nr:putative transcriptional regulator, LuxR family [Jatrophihabitans sp.]